MHYLGFDVSKRKLDVILTNLRDKTSYFTLKNDRENILKWLNSAKLPKELISGCESTAGYHLILQRIMVESGFTFKLLNPILTKQFTRATIRKRKTDKTDSLIIAKLLAQGEGKIVKKNSLNMDSKIEQRVLGKLITYKHRLSLMGQSLSLHENISGFVSKAVAKLEKQVQEEIDEYLKKLTRKYRRHKIINLLTTIPGIGFKLALIIYSEINDINNFNHPKKLVAFAGLDPKIRQSGHSINNTGSITKRGSTRLRYALYVASNVARMHDPDLKAYYQKKRKEGKKHTVATLATARKLLNRIFAIWKNRTPYIIKN